MSRPFGVALLVAGCDENGPAMFHTDPSGTFVRYEAKAIGAGSEGAQTNLQEGYSKSMTLAEAETLALSTLKQVCFPLLLPILLVCYSKTMTVTGAVILALLMLMRVCYSSCRAHD